MSHHASKTNIFPKSYSIAEKILHLPSNSDTMKRKTVFIVGLLVMVLLFGSCAGKSRAVRQAERSLEQQEKTSKKQLKKAQTAHYKHQPKKTKRMINKDKRRAERMRRHRHANPYYWYRRLHRNSISECCNWNFPSETAKILVQLAFLQTVENQKNKKRRVKFFKKNGKKSIFFLRTFK